MANIFESVRHVAWLREGPPPASSLPYTAENVDFVATRPSGGPGLVGKLDALSRSGSYLRTIQRELRNAEMVHIRCPASISFLTLLVLAVRRRPTLCWVKYAGNWRPSGREPLSYRLQRWLLEKRLHRGIVSVSGVWPSQPAHVYSLSNPSLSSTELSRARSVGAQKSWSMPVRILFVGRVEQEKGVECTLRAVAELRRRGCEVALDLAGDGPSRPAFEALCANLDLTSHTVFHGWLSREHLNCLYARAHFLLLPSSTEGFPKVLGEAMAHGAVPVASAVSAIPQILERSGCGIAVASDTEAVVEAIEAYFACPERWLQERDCGLKAAREFTYEFYLESLLAVFEDAWNLELLSSASDSGPSGGERSGI